MTPAHLNTIGGCCSSHRSERCGQNALDMESHRNDSSRTSAACNMYEANFFFYSSCPKCRREQSQGGLSRARLLRLLDSGHPIEAYCTTCDKFWAVSAQERVAIAKELVSRGGADSSTQEQGERLA